MKPLFLLAAAASVVLGLAADADAISFIDSPSPYCRRIKGNNCIVNVGYISVSASPNYMTDVWVLLDDKLVYHAGGFFQTSTYIDNRFLGDGFPVKWGNEGETPVTNPPTWPLSYGKSYSLTLRARDSANLSSANFATVICPPK